MACWIFLLQHANSCFCTWDLVPWPGIEPRPPALGTQSLGHWTTREVQQSLKIFFFASVIWHAEVWDHKETVTSCFWLCSLIPHTFSESFPQEGTLLGTWQIAVGEVSMIFVFMEWTFPWWHKSESLKGTGGLKEQLKDMGDSRGKPSRSWAEINLHQEKVYVEENNCPFVFKIWKEMYFQRHHLFSLKCSSLSNLHNKACYTIHHKTYINWKG